MENVVTQNQNFEQRYPSAAHRVLTRTVWRFSGALALALFVLLAMAGGAQAQSKITYTDTISFTSPTANLTVPQFDPSLGVLVGVEITATESISGFIGAENFPDSFQLTGSLDLQASMEANFPGNPPISTNQTLASFPVTLAGYDGTIDFDGASGVSQPVTGTLDVAAVLNTAPTMAAYIGTGTVSVPLTITNQALVNSAGNSIVQNLTDETGTLIICYLYEVPELTLEKSTNGIDADTPIGPYIDEGAAVTWTYVVSNTGTVDVPTVTVTDSVAGVTPLFVSGDDGDGILNAGETWVYEATGVATAGQYMNVGSVEGAVPGLTSTITSTDPSHYFGLNSEYVVTKTADQTVVTAGTDVTYTYLVTNTGNITLTNVVVTDDLCAPVTIVTADADGALAVGEVWEYSCTTTIGEDTTNTATVEAEDPTGPTDPITTTETVDVLPTIDVIKTTNPITVPESGGVVTFTFEVVNTSPEIVTLTDLNDSVYGDLNGQGSCATGGAIAVGASYTCAFTDTISSSSGSVTNLLHTNTVTAGAADDEGNPVSASDDAEVQLEDLLPTIEVIKTADPIAVPSAGGVVTFTFEVVNTSAEAVTLTDLTDSVYGNLDGQGSCAVGGSIAVGASYICAITDTLDINSPSVVSNIHTNTVTAIAADDEGNSTGPVTGAAEVLVASPIVEATKVDVISDTNGDGRNGPGDTISYTIVISNSGLVHAQAAFLNDLADSNTVLTVGSVTSTQGSVVTGNNAGDTTIGVDIGDIESGESVTITFDVVIVDPLPDGVTQIENQGIVTGNNFPNEPTDDPDTPADDDPTVTPLELLPELLATKSDSLFDDVDGNGSPSPGDYLKYEVVIVNNGNASATGVVFNDQPDPNTKVDCTIPVTTTTGTVASCTVDMISVDIGTIAAGAQVIIEFYVRIDNPLSSAGITQVANQGLIESNELPTLPTDDPDTPEDGDPTVTPITVAPIIESTKNDRLLVDADGDGVVSPGDILLYEVIISNEGNVPIDNIVFTDTVDANTTLMILGGDGTATFIDPVQTGQGTVITADPAGDPNVVVNVGTINPGDQVGISFRVQINNPLPTGVLAVANQGVVSGNSGDIPVEEPTDDPETPDDDDPTVTPITTRPEIAAYKSALTIGGADANGAISEGDTMKYIIRIVNSGTGAATGVYLGDTLDTNSTLVIGSVQTGRSGDIVMFGNNAGDTSVGVALDTIPGGDEVTVSFDVVLGTSFTQPFGQQDGCQLVNQAVITYDDASLGPNGQSTISSDNPNTSKPDATETTVVCTPTSLTQGPAGITQSPAGITQGPSASGSQFLFLPIIDR